MGKLWQTLLSISTSGFVPLPAGHFLCRQPGRVGPVPHPCLVSSAGFEVVGGAALVNWLSLHLNC